jgi:UDP-GlcNAc:undecaprenyl-phosphate GlcNAc-1-phosphate transferase
MIKNFSSPDMLYALAALALAFLAAYYGTPLARHLAVRCGCFDVPDGKRKLHAEPVPYFGGIAILGGFSVAFLLFSHMLTGTLPGELLVMFIGGASLCFVGLIDDMYGMRPLVKFFCQILISVFTAHFGFAIEYITLLGHTLRFGAFAELITVVWLLVIINAVNLIDGLDGLAGGVSALESFALLITAILMGNPVCAIAAAALCGATLGFLPFNFGKATIFMGDAGSMFIGYILACISVFGLFKAQALFSIIVPAMIFALPVMDTVAAFFRRIIHGQSPFAADHKHLHHVLLENGFSAKQSVVALMIASAIFCVASILYVKYRLLSVGLFALSVAFLAVLKFDKHLCFRFKKKTMRAGTVGKTNETV